MNNYEHIFIIAESCLAFFGALLASLTLTPIIRSISVEWGFVDRPDGGRKAHRTPVALGGGLAVLAGALAASGLAFAAAATRGEQLLAKTGHPEIFFALLAASVLICMVGLVDDFIGMRGRYKLMGQLFAGLILIAAGLTVNKVGFFGWEADLGLLAIPFTLFWLLGATNAVNLVDGIDGLASSVSIVLCLAVAILTWDRGYQAETIIALAMAGALLGFLRFNFAPASIYLGDSGSMLAGMVIGAIAISSFLKEQIVVALVVPLAVWAIPALDTGAAILRRKLTGRSLFATDRGHFHHSLLVRGWTARQAVVFIVLICITTCAGALASYFWSNDLIALGTVLGVIGLLVATKTFGHIEFALVRDRIHSTARAMRKHNSDLPGQVHESRIRLQGSHEWDRFWTALTESAEHYNLQRIELTLDVPGLNEAFYAHWNCSSNQTGSDDSWRVSSPLVVEKKMVGNLMVIGSNADGSSLSHIAQVADFLEPVEESIRVVVAEISERQRREEPEAETLEETVGG